MIRAAGYVIVGFLLLVLQTALLPHLLPLSSRPDLLLPLAVWLGVRAGYLPGGTLAYGLGCLEDVYTGAYLGLNGTALLAVYLVVRSLAGRLNTDNTFLLLLLVGCGTVLQAAIQLFALGFFVEQGSYWRLVLGWLPLQVTANLAASLLLLKAYGRLRPWFRRRFGGAGPLRLGGRHGS